MDLVKPIRAVLNGGVHSVEAGGAAAAEHVTSAGVMENLARQRWARPGVVEGRIDDPALRHIVDDLHLYPEHNFKRTATSANISFGNENLRTQMSRAAHIMKQFEHQPTTDAMRREGMASILEFGLSRSSAGLLPNVSSIRVPIGSELEKAYSSAHPSIVKLRDEFKSSSGSGTIISDRWIATVDHVNPDPLSPMEVHLSNGKKLQGRVIVRDSLNDLSLIETSETMLGLPKLELGSSADLFEGSTLHIMGHPAGVWTPAISAGHHLGLEEAARSRGLYQLETSVPNWEGYSGAAFLSNNKLVGILDRLLPASENRKLELLGGSTGRPVEHVKALLSVAQKGVPDVGYMRVHTESQLTNTPTGKKLDVTITAAFKN